MMRKGDEKRRTNIGSKGQIKIQFVLKKENNKTRTNVHCIGELKDWILLKMYTIWDTNLYVNQKTNGSGIFLMKNDLESSWFIEN